MKRISSAVACGFVFSFAAPALADDGSAQLGAGGIVFTKSADIRMAKEDLYVSPQKVRIRFEFANTSGKDQDVVVAFPLPDLESDAYRYTAVGTLGNDPVNFVNFTASVDGWKVPLQVEQKAIFNGKDVTAIVHSVGLPVNLIISDRGDDSDNFDLIDKLPRAKKSILEKAGIADRTNPKQDNQEDALWTVQTRFYWKQHFPAGKTVVIEHSYSPVTGSGQYDESKETGGPSQEDWVKPFCMDKATIAHLDAMLDNPKLRPKRDNDADPELMWGSVTDYILSTANTWKGPIGQFHLTLDKLDPKAVLSLCWKGTLMKSGPSTFDFSAANFAPTQDIHMAVFR